MKQFPFFLALLGSVLTLNAQQSASTNISSADTHPGVLTTVYEDFPNSPFDGYNLYVPKSSIKGNKKYPLIIFLHGGRLVGGDVEQVIHYDLPKAILESSSLETELDKLLRDSFVVLMPHLDQGEFYDGKKTLQTIIDRLVKENNVDSKRVYMTGLSRGGYGTWGLASRMNDVLAAVAPVCGGGAGIQEYSALVDLPIWVSHNTEDGVVPYRASDRIVNKLESTYGQSFHKSTSISSADYENHDQIFTSKDSDSHDAWTEMHSNVHFFKWLLRFSK